MTTGTVTAPAGFPVSKQDQTLKQADAHRQAGFFQLYGLPIAVMTYDQVLSYLSQAIETRKKTFCVTLNLDILRLACQRRDVYRIIQSSDFIFADGMPLVWLSKLMKRPLPQRVPGCDMVHDLCRVSAKQGHKIFFLGAAPGVADKAKAKLEKELPGIQIVGTHAPEKEDLAHFGTNQLIVDMINASGADVVFVALGAPKQEQWIFQNYHALQATLMVPCGASIDFIAGEQAKAPQWIGNIGLEWLYRLFANPTRLFKRYIIDDLPFLGMTLIRSVFNRAQQVPSFQG
ncbi:MAG: WecB/TagA/CpsF family glycosyltransferase [Vampirovibrio sp.]|nr:WecB/TagA/CpsF family glycosyltransferase [Vampirovibrio sp.]